MPPMQTDSSDSDYIAPGAAAAALRVTTRTLARMATRGDLKFLVLPSGHRRYARSSIERLLGHDVEQVSA